MIVKPTVNRLSNKWGNMPFPYMHTKPEEVTMSRRSVTVFFMMLVALCFFAGSNSAQGQFVRVGEIPVPETDLNNGGTGKIVANVDLDKDGKTEIYLVNDNWNDTPTELIPRIYKLEKQGNEWVVVWKAVAPIPKQNTWPFLVTADLDKDGKGEIIWGVVNFTGADNPNPARILVYEAKGDGSDEMGVPDGTGNYLPNAMWTIADVDLANIRPIQAVIADPDDDGVDEIIFADRAGKTGAGYLVGVVSVSDVPDNGDGSETWTMEVSGLDFGLKGTRAQNKWDVAVIGPNVYAFCEAEISKLSCESGIWGYYSLMPMAGGAPVQSAQVVDLDKDGVKEIIAPVYDWGNDAFKSIYLLQEEGDSLKHTELVNVSKYWPSGVRGPWGGVSGDIDGDGHLDFIYGSRASTPNAGIFHLAYKGGDITNPANYTFDIIDSLYAAGGIWTVVDLANVDDDPQLEVLYTSSTDAGAFPDLGTKPIVVLDYQGGSGGVQFDDLVIAPEVLLNGAAPAGISFKPGRILDNGKTIWFCGVNTSTRETWVFRSNDGGATFTHNAVALPDRAAQMDAFDANVALIAMADGKIHRTDDGGVTWNEVYSYNISVIAPGWFDGLRAVDENVAVAFGDFEPDGFMHFVRTTDKGLTWDEIITIDYMQAAYAYYTWGLAGCTVGQTIWVSATPTTYVGSFVFRSKDGGENWDSFSIPSEIIASYPRAIAFASENNGMIADRRGNPVASTDGGATWFKVSKPVDSADSWVNGVVAVPNSDIILGLDDLGVFYTTDLGTSWGQINVPEETAGKYYYAGVFLNKNFGYVFGEGGIVLRFKNQLTGVAVRPDEKMPASFQLHQNYPNPFNPTTTIAFDVVKPEYVSLKIFNLKGEEIKVLVDGMVSSGNHNYVWDATNTLGHRVASGIYIYQLKVSDGQAHRRMLLVK